MKYNRPIVSSIAAAMFLISCGKQAAPPVSPEEPKRLTTPRETTERINLNQRSDEITLPSVDRDVAVASESDSALPTEGLSEPTEGNGPSLESTSPAPKGADVEVAVASESDSDSGPSKEVLTETIPASGPSVEPDSPAPKIVEVEVPATSDADSKSSLPVEILTESAEPTSPVTKVAEAEVAVASESAGGSGPPTEVLAEAPGETVPSVDLAAPRQTVAEIVSEAPAVSDDITLTQWATYMIVPGDFLIKIAREEYGNFRRWREIYAWNREEIGDNPNLIYPYHYLTLKREKKVDEFAPGISEYEVSPGETLWDIAGKLYGDPVAWIILYLDNTERLNGNSNFLSPGMKLQVRDKINPKA